MNGIHRFSRSPSRSLHNAQRCAAGRIGSLRDMSVWPEPEMLAVYLPPPAVDEPDPFAPLPAGPAPDWDRDAMTRDGVRDELKALGIELSLVHEGGVFYTAADQQRAETGLRRLFGSEVPARYMGPRP